LVEKYKVDKEEEVKEEKKVEKERRRLIKRYPLHHN